MNTAIMKSLLEEYLDVVVMTSDQLAEIEQYIFTDQRMFKHIHPPEIIDTAHYLKEIAEENDLTTSLEVLTFLQDKKKRYNKFLWDLMDEGGSNDFPESSIEQESFSPGTHLLPLDTLIYPDLNSYNVQSYVKTLSRYFKHIFQSVKNHISEHQVITINLDACSSGAPVIRRQIVNSATKEKFARYFEEFSTKDKNKEIVAWTYTHLYDYLTVNYPLQDCKAEKCNLLFLHTKENLCHQDGLEKVYDNILAHVSQEQPISDESVKKELVEWLFYSKVHTAEAESLRCAIEQMSDTKTCLQVSNVTQDNLKAINLLKATYKTMLTQKQWRILKSPPGHTWIASDNPGFGINLQDLYSRPTEMIADGTLTDIRADTIIYYPISSEYCLRIQPFTGYNDTRKTHQTAIEFEQSTLEELEVVNGLTFTTKKEIVVGRDKKSFEQLESI